MSKLKLPLLSLEAHGTIADALTIQRRNRGSFARTKPIPTDPKSSAQLAHRQIYRDAVDKWNALSQEEKEAWRGVCPGLTAYQCFMRSELKYVEPTPPPEEYTEEQTSYNTSIGMYSGNWNRHGQKLTVPNREITKLGFWIRKAGTVSGDVTFEIRKVLDDSLICSKVWGDAEDLPTEATYKEAEFDTPQTIDEEVRVYCTYVGSGSGGNEVLIHFQNTDVKADEYFSKHYSDWTDQTSYDCAYRYKYYLP